MSALSGNHGALSDSAFFGRDREHAALRKELERGGSIVEVVGYPGSGKTAFLKHFEQTTSRQFPGGAEWFSGSEHFQLSEAIDVITNGFRRGDGQHLLIIDDADRLDPSDLYEAVNRLSTGPWSFSTVLSSRRPLSLGSAITLGGLDAEDFAAYLRFLFRGALDATGVRQLSDASQSSPLVARLLRNAWQHGRIPLADLAGLLLPFEQSGLVDVAGRPLTRDSAASSRIIVDARAINDEFLRRAADDPNFVFTISSREFEELVAELLSRRGYDVQLTPQTRDGGKDIYAARRDDLGTFLYIVECKRYAPDNPVGVEVIRALHGVADIERVTGAMVVTTSYYSSEARALEEKIKYRMSLKEYLDLRRWLSDLQQR